MNFEAFWWILKHFDEFWWVRLHLLGFDIQDRNKQRVLVYLRTLTASVPIARVLRPAPEKMLRQHASEICPAFQQLRENWHQKCQRLSWTWARVGHGQKQAPQSRSKSHTKILFPPNHSLELGQVWVKSGSSVVGSACLCDADQISTCNATISTIAKQIVCGIDPCTFTLE